MVGDRKESNDDAKPRKTLFEDERYVFRIIPVTRGVPKTIEGRQREVGDDDPNSNESAVATAGSPAFGGEVVESEPEAKADVLLDTTCSLTSEYEVQG